MEPQRERKAAKMKATICTVVLITQPMLCSNISATKRVITHVTIKSLAGIPANNYAVMNSVKILTVERGAYIKLQRPFSLWLSYKWDWVSSLRSEGTTPGLFIRHSPENRDPSSPQSLEKMMHHRDTWGPVCPCLSLENEKHSLQWGTMRAMFMGGIANCLNNAHVCFFTVIWSSNPMLLWVQGSRLRERGSCYRAAKI